MSIISVDVFVMLSIDISEQHKFENQLISLNIQRNRIISLVQLLSFVRLFKYSEFVLNV